MRILVVDDSEDWRDLTEAALIGAGYEDVHCVGSAREAYAFLRLSAGAHEGPSRTDLVILDVVMPDIDGIEACAHIHNDHAHADVPIIMVTTVQDMEGLANAFVAGATDYITKPFNRIELLARVRSALKIKAELDRRRAREAELVSLSQPLLGEHDTSRWIDDTTGLFVGEAAEAYLGASGLHHTDDALSVFALAVDRLDALRAVGGKTASRAVLARVGEEVRKAAGTIGTVAASYRDGMIVVVAPALPADHAKRLGEGLRSAVSRLAIKNSESIASDVVTVSIGAVTGRAGGAAERAQFVADACSIAKDAAAAGGNRVVAVDVS